MPLYFFAAGSEDCFYGQLPTSIDQILGDFLFHECAEAIGGTSLSTADHEGESSPTSIATQEYAPPKSLPFPRIQVTEAKNHAAVFLRIITPTFTEASMPKLSELARRGFYIPFHLVVPGIRNIHSHLRGAELRVESVKFPAAGLSPSQTVRHLR
uniref:Uncharacterized protein n=1 Tax=Moniliophthora roreri TaxID=221103 RepID=A0A0W0GE59_MONRR